MILPHGLRHALRSLSKSPGFFLVATACLGLSLALNTTSFAILDAMVHPSLPVKEPARLFYVGFWPRQRGNDAPLWERYQVLRAATFYEGIAFFDWVREGTLRVGAEVRDEGVCRVTSNFYSLLGVRPEVGRILGPGTPEDAAVVSHEFWERTLGGRSLEGLTTWVNEREYRVIGVLPATMVFPGSDVAIALPHATEESGLGLRNVIPVVKVRRGWSDEAVASQLATLARRLTVAYGSAAGPYAFVPHALAPRPHALREIHFAMAGAAALVLLIACANLASLMLVRGAARRREVALHLALGAGRPVVVGHLLAESAVIAAAGLGAGLLLTLWAIPILGRQMPPSVATLGIVVPHASWRVVALGVLAAVVTLGLFGVWPAFRASDVDLSEPLKDSGSVIGKARWRYHPLVVIEVALSLVLVMGVVLLTRAAGRLSDSMLGYDRQGLLDARVWLGRVVGPDSAQTISRNLLARVAALPDVRSVAVFGGAQISIVKSEFYDGFNGGLSRAGVFAVSDGFLRTLGVPVIQGRDFAPGDEQVGAVIVDQAAASRLWPDGRGVGRLINVGGSEVQGQWVRVVGIARTALVGGPPGEVEVVPEGMVYQAWRPKDRTFGWGLAIRTSTLDGAAAIALRHAIQETLPGGRVEYIQPWLAHFDMELRARYFLLEVFGAFSAFALLLAAVGLYGVVSYAVTQRMREFAVRVAVGTPRRNLVTLVAHDAAAMTLAGIGLGAFLAMWASTLLDSWLVDVYHTDAVSLIGAETLLVAVALVACLHPVLRATRANPIEILRAI